MSKKSPDKWIDNVKKWPKLNTDEIKRYLIQSLDSDNLPSDANRSFQSFNYLESGWVGVILACEKKNKVKLKGKVGRSQSLKKTEYEAFVSLDISGTILDAGCQCMAGLGKKCAHIGAILWKIEEASRLGYSGESCTDVPAKWNNCPKKNILPEKIQKMNFKRPKLPNSKNEVKSYKVPKEITIQSFKTEEALSNSINGAGLKNLLTAQGSLWNETLKQCEKLNE